MRLSASFAIAALAAAFTTSAGAATPAYAPVKKQVCQPCALPVAAAFLPKHGVLLARRGTFSFGTTYYSVDLDSARVVKTFEPVKIPSGGAKPMHEARALKPDEAASLTELMNKLWAEPAPLKPTGATDAYWDAWLADGKDVRHEHGPGNPPGAAAALENEIMRLLADRQH